MDVKKSFGNHTTPHMYFCLLADPDVRKVRPAIGKGVYDGESKSPLQQTSTRKKRLRGGTYFFDRSYRVSYFDRKPDDGFLRLRSAAGGRFAEKDSLAHAAGLSGGGPSTL